jgi:hypothetical protein
MANPAGESNAEVLRLDFDRVICGRPSMASTFLALRTIWSAAVIWGRGFGAVGEGFVVDDRGVEGCDEFEIGLAFEEVGEEIGILRGWGAELIEERLLGLQLLAERPVRVAVMTASRRRGPGATGRAWRSPWRGSLRCWKFKSLIL